MDGLRRILLDTVAKIRVIRSIRPIRVKKRRGVWKMAKKIVVVLNPTSGRGQGGKRREELKRLLKAEVSRQEKPSEWEWEIVETTAQGSGVNLAREAVAQGATIVAAAGGEGTCGEVINGLAENPASFAVLPLGTGNDFVRSLGIGTDLPLAVRTLFEGVSKPLDLGRVHGRWFLNTAGCGFDAVVGARVNRGFRYLRGTSAYLAAVLQSLATFRPVPMQLTLDGKVWETKAMLCSVCNAQYYGGGMWIAPEARLDDGLFDVCVIGDAGPAEFLTAFPRVFKGTHLTHPKVTLLRARQVRIESEVRLPILADGDILGSTPAEIFLQSHALRVLTPLSHV